MRFSELFIQTHRPTSGDHSSEGEQFLHRAGYIHQVESGIYGFLPLAKRSFQKMETNIRQSLSCLNGQEINLPFLSSQESGNQSCLVSPFDFPLLKVTDLKQRTWIISQVPTKHLLNLIQHTIRSHRMLPRLLFQIQAKINIGHQSQTILNNKASNRLECFLLEKDVSEENENLQNLSRAYQQLLTKWKLPFELIINDDLSNAKFHDFYFIHPNGDNPILYCPACGFQKHQKDTHLSYTHQNGEDIQPIEEVYTPGAKTIEELSNILHLPHSKTAKAVFLTASIPDGGQLKESVVIAVVRGDKELDENKLAQAIQAQSLSPASEDDIISIGAVPGFASPVGLKKGLIVVDDLIPLSKNLVAGANKKDYHLKNVNFKRDYQAHVIADISLTKQGDNCPVCCEELDLKSGYLISQIHKFNSQSSFQSGCFYQDEFGKQKAVQIAYAWMDYEKVFVAIAETFNDKFGLIMPFHLAPYQVHLIVLPAKNSSQPQAVSEKLYQEMSRARIEVLFDDRAESPGVKFNDADLIGIPLRITVAQKSLNEGVVEMKLRHESEKKLIKIGDLLPTIMHSLLQMDRETAQKVANNYQI